MQELTNLHASLAATAAQAQHSQAVIVAKGSPGTASPSQDNVTKKQALQQHTKSNGSHVGEGAAHPDALNGHRRASYGPVPTSQYGPSRADPMLYNHPTYAAHRHSDSTFAYAPTPSSDPARHQHPHDTLEAEAAYYQHTPRMSYPFGYEAPSGLFGAPRGHLYQPLGATYPPGGRHSPPESHHLGQGQLYDDYHAPPPHHAMARPGEYDESSAAPMYDHMFPEHYTPTHGYQSTLSASQVRNSTLAKAYPFSPGPKSSHGRPGTSDRPMLPPLGSASRPGTSSGSLLPASPSHPGSLRPLSSQGGVGGTSSYSRPPTGSGTGDLTDAFHFRRRNSMLDFTEMSLDHGRSESRPGTSSAMPPPEGAPPSRGGRNSIVSLNSAGSLGTDRTRPLSSSGRLDSSRSILPQPDATRLPPSVASEGTRTSPTMGGAAGGSPFQFQPPPLSSGGREGHGTASGSSSSAVASFLRDRPLTGSGSRRGMALNDRTGSRDGVHGPHQRGGEPGGWRSPSTSPTATRRPRPYTSAGNEGGEGCTRIDEEDHKGQSHDAEDGDEGYKPAPISDTKRVSIASLLGDDTPAPTRSRPTTAGAAAP